MPNTINAVPEGFHTITPYMVVADPARLIDFFKRAFDAKEIHRTTAPNGTVMHAQIEIGNSKMMLGAAMGPYKPSPCLLYMYVSDADSVFKRAVEAGGTVVHEPSDQFYGDRNGTLTDLAGNTWTIATHIEDLSAEELEKRARDMFEKRSQN